MTGVQTCALPILFPSEGSPVYVSCLFLHGLNLVAFLSFFFFSFFGPFADTHSKPHPFFSFEQEENKVAWSVTGSGTWYKERNITLLFLYVYYCWTQNTGQHMLNLGGKGNTWLFFILLRSLVSIMSLCYHWVLYLGTGGGMNNWDNGNLEHSEVLYYHGYTFPEAFACLV